MNIRKRYNKEFKLDAIRLVAEQGYSRKQAAKSLGITYDMLARWIREQEADNQTAFRGNGKATPELKASSALLNVSEFSGEAIRIVKKHEQTSLII